MSAVRVKLLQQIFDTAQGQLYSHGAVIESTADNRTGRSGSLVKLLSQVMRVSRAKPSI